MSSLSFGLFGWIRFDNEISDNLDDRNFLLISNPFGDAVCIGADGNQFKLAVRVMTVGHVNHQLNHTLIMPLGRGYVKPSAEFFGLGWRSVVY